MNTAVNGAEFRSALERNVFHVYYQPEKDRFDPA